MTDDPLRHDTTAPAPAPTPAHAPLAGVRILDMATVVAAPFSATLCGDLGAEVVKLEPPDGSDPLRNLLPVHDGVPLYWKVVNRGKRGISLDVRKPAGRELLLRLLPRFDVLVEVPPRHARSLGAGHRDLHAGQPAAGRAPPDRLRADRADARQAGLRARVRGDERLHAVVWRSRRQPLAHELPGSAT